VNGEDKDTQITGGPPYCAGCHRSASQSQASSDSGRSSTAIFDIQGAMPADPTNFNPYAVNQQGFQGLNGAIFEPLFVEDILSQKLEPWLALTIEPDADYKVWTLTLRPGVTWSDGYPFTADDVVFTVQMLQKNPQLQSPVDLSGVTATKVNTLTVRFSLKQPDPRFAETFGGVGAGEVLWIVPEHIWKNQPDLATFSNYNPAKGWPVGTGAYKLTKITQDSYTYQERDNWWGVETHFKALPAPKTLVWLNSDTEQTTAGLLADNELDNGQQFSLGTLVPLMAKNPNITAWSTSPPYGFTDSCARSLDFNTQQAPWNDPDMRWAVAYAINRNEISQTAFDGLGTPNYTMFPNYPGLQPYVEAMTSAGLLNEIKTYDPAKSIQILKSQGYTRGANGMFSKNGQPLSLTINNYDDPTINQIVATIVEQLRNVGINASANTLTVPNFVAAELPGHFEANLFFGACGSTSDPWLSMNSFNVSQYQPTGKAIAGFYSNPFRWNDAKAKQYSAIVDQIADLPAGDPAITPLVVQAMTIWYQDLPMIPIMQNPYVMPVNNTYWTGWPTKDNPYVQPIMDGSATVSILTHLQPAK
jgi:peptide/nickel transport system substrate-binding protein